MESHTAARSMLASFLTFQFLCESRSSQGSFFASLSSFSSSDIFTNYIDPIYKKKNKCRIASISTILSGKYLQQVEHTRVDEEMLRSDALNRSKQTEREGEGREKKRWVGGERVEERDFALPFFRFSFPVRQKGILGCTHSGKAIPSRRPAFVSAPSNQKLTRWQ